LYKKRQTIIKAKNGEIEQLKLEMSELKVMMAEVSISEILCQLL
jgi:hypothetical protein